MENRYRGGALRDNRTDEERAKSPKHTYSGLVQWTDTPNIPGHKPSQRNQRGNPDSSSCVAQSKASDIESNTGIVASAQQIFIRRIGAPTSEGMYLYDAGNIVSQVGTSTEAADPSQHMSDAQLDIPSNAPIVVKSTGPDIEVQIDADHVADAILTGMAVSMTFESNESEWDAPNCTPVYNGTETTFGHCISLYGFFLNGGVKTFIGNDSDGQWSSANGIRYITEDFLLKRATGASYSPDFVVLGTNPAQPSQTQVTETISTPTASIRTTAPALFFSYIISFLRSLGIPLTISPGEETGDLASNKNIMTNSTNAGTYIVFASLLVMALAHFGIVVPQSEAIDVITFSVTVVAAVFQHFNNKQVQAAGRAGGIVR